MPDPIIVTRVAVKKNKGEVSYRSAKSCKGCDYFYTAGRCYQVEGNISPDGMCDLWEPIGEKSPYKDKAFFENEYNKSNKGA